MGIQAVPFNHFRIPSGEVFVVEVSFKHSENVTHFLSDI